VARLKVIRSYKGDAVAGETVTLTLPRGSSASCSLDAMVGARFVIFATVRDGVFSTNLCSGSHRIAPGTTPPELPAPCPRGAAAADRSGRGCQA
jgi:hypothetical protein